MVKIKFAKMLCFFSLFVSSTAFGEAIHCKLSDKIFMPYNRELQKQKRLFVIGSGGAMMGDIQKVNASYLSFERMNLEEARKLYIEVVEGYINQYNKDEPIRPYLHDYPVTIENFQVRIGYENDQRKHMGEGYIAYVFKNKNNVIYCTYDHEKKDFIDHHEEPYETARDIVLKNSCRNLSTVK